MNYLAMPHDHVRLLSGHPEYFHYVGSSGKGSSKIFCHGGGARLFTGYLQRLPGTILVSIGSLDNTADLVPTVEVFITRRLDWAIPLDVPQFDTMPG